MEKKIPIIFIICDQCGKKFWRTEYEFKRGKHNFCSRKCHALSTRRRININCGKCEKLLTNRKPGELKDSKSGYLFCNKSCSVSYNNTLKRKSRRSKIEIKLFNLLQNKYSNLDILANDKKMLNGLETDIAIPSLKLAIEWNGIIHFKPIYGKKTLNKVQKKDKEKLKIANKKDINLIVIPDLVSNDKILQKAFEDICTIVENLIKEKKKQDIFYNQSFIK